MGDGIDLALLRRPPAHVTLAETSPAHRDDADGSLHVDSALLTPVPEVARRPDANVTWQVDVYRLPARHDSWALSQGSSGRSWYLVTPPSIPRPR
jgi:hypothetical protein